MTLFSQATSAPSDSADIVLGVLADATHGRFVAADRRVLASLDSYSPDEGLALLDAYVSISDVSVRQAILDLVLSIAGTNPYCRTRAQVRSRADGL